MDCGRPTGYSGFYFNHGKFSKNDYLDHSDQLDHQCYQKNIFSDRKKPQEPQKPRFCNQTERRCCSPPLRHVFILNRGYRGSTNNGLTPPANCGSANEHRWSIITSPGHHRYFLMGHSPHPTRQQQLGLTEERSPRL